jgi:hypothetical protein
MIWNPWRRIADLERRIVDLTWHVQGHEAHIAVLQRGLDVAADRYDKIRETNLQLRDALELYRKA